MTALPEILIRDMNFDDVAAVVGLERQAYPFPWSEGIFRDACVWATTAVSSSSMTR